MIILGFNRNIVECKDSRTAGIKDTQNGFNRNIVECKARAEGTPAAASM